MKEIVEHDQVRTAVRERYGALATAGGDATCGCACCSTDGTSVDATRVGYSKADLQTAPPGADMGLGCGNPVALAAIKAGETVLDLGSGGGFDCFLAAGRVGPHGRVIGVDMTPAMVSKAREAATMHGVLNVEFRLGEIEHLPVADASIDLILSNCVINLSPEKAQVFREAFRVLKPGGRLAIADIVAVAPIPESARLDIAALTGCLAGAATVEALETMLVDAGFEGVEFTPREQSREFIREWVPGTAASDYVESATIGARKPHAKEVRR